MDNSVATASRNILRIKLRKYRYLMYRGVQETLRKVGGGIPNDIESIMFYPEVSRENDLSNIINQLSWYLPEDSVDSPQIHIPLDDELDISSARSHPPSNQAKYPDRHLSLYDVKNPRKRATEVDVILLWNYKLSPLVLRHLNKIYIVDPNYYSLIESDRWHRVSIRTSNELEDSSEQNYSKLETRAENYSEAYIFATGPSLNKAYNFDFPDNALKIICNSIVNNDELLNHVNPDVLVFADPVFHFGPSKYANEFRRDAVKTVMNHDCFVVIPQRFRRLFLEHFPQVSNKLISTPTANLSEPRFPNSDDLTVMSTNNIMTRYMVPVASSLTDEIYIIGADGREDDESYFWEHSDEAQYTGLMETVVECHPSFFRDRIYTDYYKQHIETFSDMLDYGENQGKRYYSLTDSYIPCLNNRTVDKDKLEITKTSEVSS